MVDVSTTVSGVPEAISNGWGGSGGGTGWFAGLAAFACSRVGMALCPGAAWLGVALAAGGFAGVVAGLLLFADFSQPAANSSRAAAQMIQFLFIVKSSSYLDLFIERYKA
jgi:hypothetical protein